jgi:hypothetical protein
MRNTADKYCSLILDIYVGLRPGYRPPHPFGDLGGLRPPGPDYLSRLMNQQGEVFTCVWIGIRIRSGFKEVLD